MRHTTQVYYEEQTKIIFPSSMHLYIRFSDTLYHMIVGEDTEEDLAEDSVPKKKRKFI